MLHHIIATARASGISRLSLETGSWDYFQPAHALYRSHGFVECQPFADYVLDPNSVFISAFTASAREDGRLRPYVFDALH
jgi:putative acetyltransferase